MPESPPTTLPGLVDVHVHVNEPGRTEWEGFETATRAAAAGGVTTLIDMPLNAVPATTDVAAYEQKLAAAEGKCWVDVGFWGGVVPGNARDLRPLWEAGVFGFKCFLCPSGVDEFPAVGEDDLRQALPILAGLGAPLLVHAELPGPIEAAARAAAGDDPRRYATYLRTRPPASEHQAIELMVRLCREYRALIHIVHLSSAGALPLIAHAKDEGLPLTVETCPHYLHFTAEDVPDGATEYKCAPPIRERENRERLWAALGEGLIDFIASDHSPCPPDMKLPDAGDCLNAWGGIASLQLGLSVVWQGARERGYSLDQVANWMSRVPLRFLGLEPGSVAGNRVVFDADAEWTVTPDALHHRHRVTPYLGETLPGVVRETYLRGQRIYDRGTFSPGPCGRILLRGR